MAERYTSRCLAKTWSVVQTLRTAWVIPGIFLPVLLQLSLIFCDCCAHSWEWYRRMGSYPAQLILNLSPVLEAYYMVPTCDVYLVSKLAAREHLTIFHIAQVPHKLNPPVPWPRMLGARKCVKFDIRQYGLPQCPNRWSWGAQTSRSP